MVRSFLSLRASVRAGIALLMLGAAAGCARRGPARLYEADIRQLQSELESGSITSRQLVEWYLARIAAYDKRGPRINAMIYLNPAALTEADSLDAERRAGRSHGPLFGIPIVLKDNYDTEDMPTTDASKAFEGMRPATDAFQVKRLRAAGAIIIGKTNMHEFARGITTISSLGGQTLNPYDPTRNPGGSSGGTGAAVAANFAAAGMGSDTCGSIRIPCAHNSLVGIRTTRGLASRAGVIPLSSTQDVAGPIARTVEDVAVLLDATVGYDPDDPVTALGVGHVPPTYTAFLRQDGLQGARIGRLTDLFGAEDADREVAEIVRRAGDEMVTAGAEVLDLSIPGLTTLLRQSSVIDYEFPADLSTYLATVSNARFKSLAAIFRSGLFDPALHDVLERTLAAKPLTSPEYLERMVRRDRIRLAVLSAMADRRLDAVLYPTLTREAAPIGEPQQGSNCSLSATSGLPAISVPAGFTADGLPVGAEFLGRPFEEGRLLRLAYAFEQATHHRQPPATTPPLGESGRQAANGVAP